MFFQSLLLFLLMRLAFLLQHAGHWFWCAFCEALVSSHCFVVNIYVGGINHCVDSFIQFGYFPCSYWGNIQAITILNAWTCAHGLILERIFSNEFTKTFSLSITSYISLRLEQLAHGFDYPFIGRCLLVRKKTIMFDNSHINITHEMQLVNNIYTFI